MLFAHDPLTRYSYCVPILKDEAQVLRVHEQGNTSLVVVMFGRALGQFHVHIKGARRWP